MLVKEQLVEFNQLAIEHANGHEDMLNRFWSKKWSILQIISSLVQSDDKRQHCTGGAASDERGLLGRWSAP